MQWTMNGLMELSTGYWRAGALMAAVELDLFAALGEDGSTTRETAGRLNASERHVAALLTALAALNILCENNGRYSLDPGVAPFLTPGSPVCLLDSLRFNADLYALWGRLAGVVRSGSPAIPPGAHLGMDAERTRRFVLGMHSRALGLAPILLPALAVSPDGSLLDLASGPGTFSRILAEQYPGLRVTQMDLPAVLEVAGELTAASPARERIQFLPGDYHKDEPGGVFDTVLFCGALHQESVEQAQAVLSRIVDSLRPGGRLIVADLMLDDDGPEPAFAALFALTMMLTSPAGGVHSTREAGRMLQAAGLDGVVVSAVGDLPYRIVSGVKPG